MNSDRRYDAEVHKKHDKIIEKEARNRQKWTIGDPDVQAMKQYLKKAESREAAPAMTGMAANMILNNTTR